MATGSFNLKGLSKSSGGKPVLVNDLVTLNRSDDNPTINDMELLKSGTVIKNTEVGEYQSVSFSVAGQDTTPTGITWDGSHFWVVGFANDTVYKYTSAGV